MLLHPDEIKKSVEPLGWEYLDRSIVKTFDFHSYRDAVDFAVSVSDIAERLDHHPRITINYKDVVVKIWSHDLGGVSTKCINLASSIDRL